MTATVLEESERVTLTVPQLGEGLHEVIVVEQLVAAGDPIVRGQQIYTMETDKSVVEAEAPFGGLIVKWLVDKGQTVPVGGPIAIVAVPREAEAPHEDVMTAQGDDDVMRHAYREEGDDGATARIAIPPRTRAYARSKSISDAELGAMAPSDGARKLMPADVDRYIGEKAAFGESFGTTQIAAFDVIEIDDRQRTLAARLAASAKEVVPGSISMPVDWSALVAAAKGIRFGDALSLPASPFQILSYIVASVSRDHAKFRSTFHKHAVRRYRHLNLGIAVPLKDDNLATAAIRGADSMSLVEFISSYRSALRDVLRSGDQAAHDIPLHLSYLGNHGVRDAVPVLCSPAVAVMFIGAPYRDGDTDSANLVLTFDHRAINGVGAARFLGDVAERIRKLPVLLIDDKPGTGASADR
jgi:pyruvate dehydrogenase E2 component (dihydrolipoamide acetyltransferase)